MNKYNAMVLAGAASFGVLSTFVKLAYRDGYTAAEVSFSQAAIGMAVLWGLALFQHGSRTGLGPGAWARLLATGSAIGLTTFTYYLSVQYIPASLAIVLLMQFTWLGPLLDWWLSGRKPQAADVRAMGLILVGTILASGLLRSGPEHRAGYGIGLALLSAVFYTFYIVANSRADGHTDPLVRSAVIMTGSTIGILLVNAPVLVHRFQGNGTLLRWALVLALFGTIIPPLLFAKAIPRVGAGLSSLLLTAELPVAVFCSHLILKEPLQPEQWAGTTLMLGAIVSLKRRKADGGTHGA